MSHERGHRPRRRPRVRRSPPPPAPATGPAAQPGALASLLASARASWGDWVDFWDEREHPASLGFVRLLLGLCWSYDLLHIWQLDLVMPLFGVGEIGGFSDALMRTHVPLYYRWFPGTPWAAALLHTTMTLSALSIAAGFFTRTACFVLLSTWAMFVDVLPLRRPRHRHPVAADPDRADVLERGAVLGDGRLHPHRIAVGRRQDHPRRPPAACS